jgi:hypothetical protein
LQLLFVAKQKPSSLLHDHSYSLVFFFNFFWATLAIIHMGI